MRNTETCSHLLCSSLIAFPPPLPPTHHLPLPVSLGGHFAMLQHLSRPCLNVSFPVLSPGFFSHLLLCSPSLPLTLLLVFSITHTHITVFTHIPLTVLVHSGAQETSCEKTIDISGATTHTMWCPAAPKQLSFSRQVLMLCKKQMCPSLRQWSQNEVLVRQHFWRVAISSKQKAIAPLTNKNLV